MPAFNAEDTIELSIKSLLNQTFRDFELIVSDNASADGTWAIVEKYSRQDRRVVGIRQSTNVGANGNYSAVFHAARGRYFKWASSNDWCAPNFLERCVEHLEQNADTVLAAPQTRLFAVSPEIYVEYDGDIAFDQPSAIERFKLVTSRLALNNVLNGVIRSDALRRTKLVEHFPGSDVVLVAHLSLIGKIALLNDPLFYRCMSPESATRMKNATAVHDHHYPHQTLRSLFPSWRYAGALVNSTVTSELCIPETLSALHWAFKLVYWKRKELLQDIVDASRYPFRSRQHVGDRSTR